MIEKMKICIDGKETEINTIEIASYIIADLNVIIGEEIDKVLVGMPESDKKKTLTSLLVSSVKHNIAKKLED